jgi:hypothetical protein
MSDVTPATFQLLQTLSANADDLQAGITGAVAEVTPDVFHRFSQRNSLQVGCLSCYSWKSHRTVTLIHQTTLDVFGYISVYLVLYEK